LPGVDFEQIDFTTYEARLQLKGMLARDAVDVVLSDMASPSTGHRKTDHLRIVALCEDAFDFARTHLKQGGAFLAKVLQGGTERDLLDQMKRDFRSVRHVKPKASRADSSETYVLATGFRADTSC
jgi:23S rRNA (uridine2552-2'-O)-methyltransferase